MAFTLATGYNGANMSFIKGDKEISEANGQLKVRTEYGYSTKIYS